MTLLRVEGLTVSYLSGGLWNKQRSTAVSEVSFELKRGETLGLVGESGSGKSTIARALLRLIPAASGQIEFDREDVLALKGEDLRAFRARAQMIFQDPYSSLNPRFTVFATLAEPLRLHHQLEGAALQTRVRELMQMVGLGAEMLSRYPHQFSGGQRQRIGIARALACGPELLVADEPVSALDVSIQAQIITLLTELQQRLGLTLLFISHDLAVVRQLCHRVAVMFAGRIVEIGSAEAVCENPQHPYTQALVAAAPSLDGTLMQAGLEGAVLRDQGCSFRTRCPLVIDRCEKEIPPLAQKASENRVACWRGGDGGTT